MVMAASITISLPLSSDFGRVCGNGTLMSHRNPRRSKHFQAIKKSRITAGLMAAELGFEPRQTVPETGVLPLHNSAMSFI